MPEKTPKRWRYRFMVMAWLLISSLSGLNAQSIAINGTVRDAFGNPVLSLRGHDISIIANQMTLLSIFKQN
jgi:hypothetical protein